MTDHEDRMPPAQPVSTEEARAIDALIASQTKTEIDDATADRLLSFVADQSAEAETAHEGSGAPVRAELLVPRKRRAALVAAAAIVVASLFLLYGSGGDKQGTAGRGKNASAVKKGAVKKGALKKGAVKKEAAPGIAKQDAESRGFRVFGAAKKVRIAARSYTKRDLARAFDGHWFLGYENGRLRKALAEICMEESPLLVRAEPKRTLPAALSERIQGPSALTSRQALLVSGCGWLLDRFDRQEASADEILQMGRILSRARGDFRARLVAEFRQRLRVSRLVARLSARRHSSEARAWAPLLAAIGVRESARICARLPFAIQDLAAREACRSGDALCQDYLLDLIREGKRRNPGSLELRLRWLARLRGPVLHELLAKLEARSRASPRLADRELYAVLAGSLVARS